ncbi:DUF3553 domain-containing protein [Actinoallomurus iriomotensis]|uniref:DUF3553 domain-containing protein n=1 Tax=Actinoallomurus iriomotensis TaxID=478107 RepID=A0A9W6S6Z6_9ACTN|nr:DUF3553 domain-containing protein [Actinoallomurus iriomotensis]GLY88263.1 hypothetical protein Airi02_061920 [Actinoallomurus iriomotensis]
MLNLLESAGAVRLGRRVEPVPGAPAPAEAAAAAVEEDAAYAPGERVHHREWGRGTLLGYKDGRLTVVFDDVGYKELLEDTVAGEGLLRPVRD